MRRCFATAVAVLVLSLSACSSGSAISAAPDASDASPALDLKDLERFGCKPTYQQTVDLLCGGAERIFTKTTGSCRGRRAVGFSDMFNSTTCVYDDRDQLVGGEICTDSGSCGVRDFAGCEHPSAALVCPADASADG